MEGCLLLMCVGRLMLCGQQGQMEILVALKERFRKELPSVSIEVTEKFNFIVQPLHMKIDCEKKLALH